MDPRSAYLPQDRYRALAAQADLPTATAGTVLSADLVGFTPLTLALVAQFGERRGADILSEVLNAVYTPCIHKVIEYGGTVLGFSGDGFLGWFPADDGDRAATCALQLQRILPAIRSALPDLPISAPLAMRVALAEGSVRRFVIGDPTIQLIDVLAGALLDRLAELDALGHPGEIVLDDALAAALIQHGAVIQRRDSAGAESAIALLADLPRPPAPQPAEPLPVLADDVLRPWLLPQVFARLTHGQGEFLTELRPAVALFVRIHGMTTDAPDAQGVLDRLLRMVQAVISTYEGNVLQATIGEKGSYLYCSFGAPLAHEDDAIRAVHAARAIVAQAAALPGIGGVACGISQGIMRTGAYGSPERRTYGVLGEATNLAARLMQAARPGQILLSADLGSLATAGIALQPGAPLRLKGYADPVAVWEMVETPPDGRPAPIWSRSGPLVGRQEELAQLRAAMDQGHRNQGQIVVIHGPAGIGKSRLLAEAFDGNAGVVAGACHAYSSHIPYAAWQPIWRAILGLDQGQPAAAQQAALGQTIERWLPGSAARLPLLGPLVGLSIAETALTGSLSPKLRKEAGEALLDDLCRRWIALGAAPAARRIIVLEDVHWMDSLSLDLLVVLGRLTASLPLGLFLTCRSEQLDVFDPSGLLGLAQTQQITVPALSRDEVARLVEARAVGDSDPGAAPAHLELLMDRTAGNPLYVEELLRYWALPGHAGDPGDEATASTVPATIQRLILARVDRLAAQQQDLLKVSSMLDDMVYPPWVCGFYPAVGSLGSTWRQCEDLCQRSFLRPQAAAGLESYAFLHSLTQDALYTSLAYATRARLHEQYAAYLEAALAESSASLTYRLAYHYGRSANAAKKRLALRAAGDLARATYANRSAIQYYTLALDGALDPAEQVALLGLLGDVWEASGDLIVAIGRYEAARAIAVAEGDRAQEAYCCYRLGVLERVRGGFAAATDWLDHAAALYTGLADQAGYCEVQTQLGAVYWSQQRYDQAQPILDAAVAIATQLQDSHLLAKALSNRGNIAYSQGHYAQALEYYQGGYERFLDVQDLPRAATIAANMAAIAFDQGAYTAARQRLEDLLPRVQELGVKNSIAFVWGHLSSIAYVQGNLDEARRLATSASQAYREIGSQRELANTLQTLGAILYGQRDFGQAKEVSEEALDIARGIGTQDIVASALNVLGGIACRQGNPAMGQRLLEEGLHIADQINAEWFKALLLLNLSDVWRSQGNLLRAWETCVQSIHRAQEIEAAAIIPQGAIRIAQLLLDRAGALAEPAARLAGAAEALLTRGGGVLEPDEADIHREVLARAAAILAPAVLAQAQAAGTLLTSAELVALVACHAPAPAQEQGGANRA